MQYYYECLEVYEKLLPEVKKHCKALKKLDATYLAVRSKYLSAFEEFENQKEHMSPSVVADNNRFLARAGDVLTNICDDKLKTSNSLMITIEYHLSRINGYVREFKCEIDSDSPGTSIEIEKKFMEVNKKRLKEIQDLREEYVLLDDMFKIPQADPEETVTEPTIETTNARINGHRQNIATIYQNIVSSFQDEQPGIRSTSRKNSLKIKAERRGSMNGGTPSPRAVSPRISRPQKFSNNNDSLLLLNVPEPSPSSNSVSPMEVSPGPHGNITFNYSESNLNNSSSFSTMPSFSGSQESRHGRQRKFTPKVQQMFKENKAGRPSHYPPNFPNSGGIDGPVAQVQQFNSSNPHTQIKVETPHPIASSSYSFPQDYSRLPQPTSQSHFTYTSSYINLNSQVAPSNPLPLQQQHNSTFQPQHQHYYRQDQTLQGAVPNGTDHHNETNDEEDDERSWCFCGEKSYGPMIACENPDCLYRWFHYSCVGIENPPIGTWFCPDCSRQNRGRGT